MDIKVLDIEGAYLFTPQKFGDERGFFSEQFKAPKVREVIGHDFTLEQLNFSTSSPGVIRGIHFADVPPSQAKYVFCTHGSILDVVIDIRVGSATFGQWRMVELNAENRSALYLSEGLGHAFFAQTECAVTYLCNQGYNPGREHGIHPLDPEIGINWPQDADFNLSAKDAAAPTLAEALETGLLPDYAACVEYQRSLNLA